MEGEETQVPANTENGGEGNGSGAEETISNQGGEAASDPAKLQQIAEDQRKRAEKAEAELKKLKTQPAQTIDPEEIIRQAEAKVEERFMQRDLDAMGHPDEITEKIKTLAKLENITVRQAEQHPYIRTLIDEHKRQERVANASPSAGSAAITYTFDPENPPDVDLTTPEGQEAMEQWEQGLERTRKSV